MNLHKENIPRIGITLGDYNGIGPEIILKCIEDTRILEFYTPVIFGSPKVFSFYKKILNMHDVNLQFCKHAGQISTKKINLFIAWDEETNIQPGTPDAVAGSYALKSLKAALDAYKEKFIDAIVTAPLDKNSVNTTEVPFRGHTEYIADYLNGKSLMIMTSEKLKIALTTGHIPLKQVSGELSIEKIVTKAKMLNHSLVHDYLMPKPRIAILGLNPHAGDKGLIGKEDMEMIVPACEQLRKDGILAYGPYPADGFFAANQFLKFDGILAMYHDQGLIPFKYIAGEEGVNFTAGLELIRTSPDHGTAYDIAGKGIANHESMNHAIFEAIKLYRNRHTDEEIRSNPLAYSSFKKERFRMDF